MIARLFKKKEKFKVDGSAIVPLQVDMHSHLLPGIDDGAQTLADSLELIASFRELGFKKLITTPHIMSDFYKNTPEIIREKLAEVRQALKERSIDMEIEAAAEYYLDESFMESLRNESELLTFGGKYLLFETSYMQESAYLDEAIFLIRSLGLVPVLAHPERYVYLFGKPDRIREIAEKEVLFQVNINSLMGYYSPDSKKVAEELFKSKMVAFLGSDCHNTKHMTVTQQTARESNTFKFALTQNLLNNRLL